MSNRTLNLDDTLYNYLLKVSLREPAILKALRDETMKLTGHEMQISPEQGQFMGLLIELIGAKKTIEIGVYTGYSSLAVALALPENGKIIACDVNKESTDVAQKYWHEAHVSHKIDLQLAPALKTLNTLIKAGESETFDFVFIDADKDNYGEYYEQSLKLLRRGGLMVIDNTLWGGDVANPSVTDSSTQAIRELNLKLHQDERVTLSLLPLGDGLSLARKR